MAELSLQQVEAQRDALVLATVQNFTRLISKGMKAKVPTDEGDLRRSVRGRTMKRGGEVEGISHRLLLTGVFVDKGVGRGYPISSVAQTTSAIKGRKPEPFITETYNELVPDMADAVAEINADLQVKFLNL